jgi:hypothetical protein
VCIWAGVGGDDGDGDDGNSDVALEMLSVMVIVVPDAFRQGGWLCQYLHRTVYRLIAVY